MTATVTRLDLGTYVLGEGPRWDERAGTLSWVDITPGRLHTWQLESGQRSTVECNQELGAANPRQGGGYVAALHEGVGLISAQGELTWLARGFLPHTHRFNDAICDARGRLWAGSTALDMGAQPGALYRIEPDGAVTVAVDDVLFPNGMGFSPDGGTLYVIDSLRYALLAFDFDVDAGVLTNRRMAVFFNPGAGFADGMAVDSDGGLWVARMGQGTLSRFDEQGAVTAQVQVPGTQPTSLTFGGAGLTQMYVTTARQFLDTPTVDDGALFQVDGAARGLPAYAFGG
jgi:sugar lactone lactonase YvrE